MVQFGKSEFAWKSPMGLLVDDSCPASVVVMTASKNDLACVCLGNGL